MFLRILRTFISILQRSHSPSTAPSTSSKRRYRNTQVLEPILTPSALGVDLGEDSVEPDSPELDWFTATETPIFITEEILGVFTAGETGTIEIEFLHDGGAFESEVAIFSLAGLEHLDPASDEFVTTALSRANSNSHLGQVIISEPSGDRATFADFEQLPQPGVTQTVTLDPGEQFAVVIIPNGTIAEALETRALIGEQRPLFSIAQANHQGAEHLVAWIGEGEPTIFGIEDSCHEQQPDFNDIVLRIEGVQAQLSGVDPTALDEASWDFFEALDDYVDANDVEIEDGVSGSEPSATPRPPELADASSAAPLNGEVALPFLESLEPLDAPAEVEPLEPLAPIVQPAPLAEPQGIEPASIEKIDTIAIPVAAETPDAAPPPELLSPATEPEGEGLAERTQVVVSQTAIESGASVSEHQDTANANRKPEVLQRISDTLEQVEPPSPEALVQTGIPTPPELTSSVQKKRSEPTKVLVKLTGSVMTMGWGTDLAQLTQQWLEQLAPLKGIEREQVEQSIKDFWVKSYQEAKTRLLITSGSGQHKSHHDNSRRR